MKRSKGRRMSGGTSAIFPGIGPVTEQRLVEVGIGDVGALRKVGAADAYRRLKFRFGKGVTLNALYGLEAVIRGCHWRDVPSESKEELKRAVDVVAVIARPRRPKVV